MALVFFAVVAVALGAIAGTPGLIAAAAFGVLCVIGALASAGSRD
jgi:hypothetical protein